jgi:hypothetical protein
VVYASVTIDYENLSYRLMIVRNVIELHGVMAETQEQWYHRQAVEQLAQHIPFERDTASKAEQIEMLRGLVLRHGRDMDPSLFGFEARNELMRLGLWMRIGKEHG